ncbi:hypothetical protein AVEN_68179-1 [Araneus ventricosus]|uniref:Uncharacterized protein n=1 Tax=Araneus ventricosus TaxID=182803 RepID=A0A4Y2P0T4_ARAVE|nr:hypothetical protein AVEN_68179-1 [Araneus ventricosus]
MYNRRYSLLISPLPKFYTSICCETLVEERRLATLTVKGFSRANSSSHDCWQRRLYYIINFNVQQYLRGSPVDSDSGA